jgi:hypothetical protein
MKTCSVCSETKPQSEFAKRNDRPSGVQSRCKECQRSKRCADCDAPITRYATYCLSCRFKRERNPIYGTTRPDHVKEAQSRAQKGVPDGPRPLRRAGTANGGRGQANRLYVKPDTCERCGERKRLDWHHVNSDPTDNRRENLRALCRRCHQIEDGRHDFISTEMPSMGRAAQIRHAAPPSSRSKIEP